MFNLDQAITDWRRQMIASGIKSSEVLDELESHLREDVERRMRSGTPAQQAFEEAVQQVGNAGALQQEFAKVARPAPRLSYNFQRAACIGMALFIVLVETWTLFAYEMTWAKRFLGLALVLASATYICVFPYINRNCWKGLRGLRIREALGAVCFFLVPLQVLILFLGLWNVIHLPPAVIFNRVFWLLMCAATVTTLVFAYGVYPGLLKVFTPAAQQSFEVARAEALRFHHNFVGTEHVLLGLLGTENSPVPGVLGKMGVSCETVRAEIEKIVGSFKQFPSTETPPYTPRARKALGIALREAKKLRRDTADTEHLFLGLVLEGSGVAALVLKNLGVNPENAREELLRMCR